MWEEMRLRKKIDEFYMNINYNSQYLGDNI